MHHENTSDTPKGVMVGLSGGVDSAVAAHLLLQQGYQVEALFMKNWEEDDEAGYCAAAEDLADAQAVAERLGIRLRTVNFSTEYWDQVFAEFLREYQALRTPNPDVLCNKEIKFTAFLDYALSLGAEAIATGHYARITRDSGGSHLCRCADEDKDQTYFLHLLSQDQLSHTLFPLQDLTKSEVRAIARQIGLANAEKKDSTGICFIGERRFRDFLARYLPREPGPIETPEGKRIGEHQGLAYYTIGQRQGLGIGGVAEGREAPWYVVAKDAISNCLIVAQDSHHPLLMSKGLEALRPHWIQGRPPTPLPYRCLCRLRHRQPLQICELVSTTEDGCRVRFIEPQRAVTPGQSIVFYQDEACLGGAVIERGWSDQAPDGLAEGSS
ncbi:tRNA 2-thiouridine(34) synthase MnmA [Thiorhodococcus mannitoliphagus]|uniref:tRNA-specific 2-thiouridylase MnmA n=1 Tax=Thiorhodococcus mannitoliphagus TaxID=329406 RepID=A0A6P1DTH2_9GAMM|nr:tRNA 2-thiouridine(34) synthase MnmA [Thiorhodococcus mannitoliphagus]NEX18984.1 tRNA 2-thiouridine(34) synthase MnmA [Thiorhodococcus mannitoliphagus]